MPAPLRSDDASIDVCPGAPDVARSWRPLVGRRARSAHGNSHVVYGMLRAALIDRDGHFHFRGVVIDTLHDDDQLFARSC